MKIAGTIFTILSKFYYTIQKHAPKTLNHCNKRRHITLSRQFYPNRRVNFGENERKNDNRLLLLMIMRIEIGSEICVTGIIGS
ncbi:hypothetical protein L1887_23177 [Cichorium endivia]|nr:hypothetical protein L1887_23177 [Cichorium endivia]